MQILLWILFILLLILALFLFMPFFYCVEGKIGRQTEVSAKISWFFRLFRVNYEESDFVVKIGPYKVPASKFAMPVKKKPKDKKLKSKDEFKLSDLPSMLTNFDIKPIISLGMILIKKLLKKVAPAHFKVQGTVGLDDPCATGQFIGFYEAATSACGLREAIDLKGDFSQKHLDLELKMSGRFAVASLLGPCIWFVFQKPVRAGIKKFKQERKRIV